MDIGRYLRRLGSVIALGGLAACAGESTVDTSLPFRCVSNSDCRIDLLCVDGACADRLQTGGVDAGVAPTPGPCRITSRRLTGEVFAVSYLTYFDGLLVRRENDSDNDGVADNAVQIFYGADGLRVSESYLDGMGTRTGGATYFRSRTDPALLIRKEHDDHGNDGVVDRTHHYRYEMGRRSQTAIDLDADGVPEVFLVDAYQDGGRRVRQTRTEHGVQAGQTFYFYNSIGSLGRTEHDVDNDGAIDFTRTYAYQCDPLG